MSDNTLTVARALNVSTSTLTTRDSVGILDNNDYYRFSLVARSSLNLTVNGLSGDANVQLIQDRNLNGQVNAGEVVASSTQRGTATESIQTTLNPGTYYIRVHPGTPFANANYRLNVSAINTGVTLGTFVDFNGDGKGDFIRQEKSAWDDDMINTANVYLSNGDGTFRRVDSLDWTFKGDLTNLIFGDYNGDGRTDFIRQEKGVWDDDNINTANIYLSNGDGTFRSQLLTNWGNMKGDFTNLIVGDYNGDRRTDFIRQEKGAWDDDNISTAEVYLSNGNGTFRSQLLTNSDNMKGDFTNLMVGDYNGDGRSDFIRQEKGGWDDDDISTAEVYLSNGNGTFRSQLLTDWQFMKGDFTNLIVGDYNGDGRSDFIRQEKSGWDDDENDRSTAILYFANGDGTFRKSYLADWAVMKGDLTNLIVGDYNGDGKSDFIRQEKGSWDDDTINTANVYLSTGDGTFRKVDIPDWRLKGDSTNLIVSDFNGDGKFDFIRQEKGEWDNDDFSTANSYLSHGDGTFRQQDLTDWVWMKGDLSYISANNQDLANREWWKPTTPVGQWLVQYYDNRDLSGDPTYTGYDRGIDYNWGQGNPGFGVSSDNFSARWTGTFGFEQGNYRFRASVDDGMRIWINGTLIHDTWNGRNATDYVMDREISAGAHTITVEYREFGLNAIAKFGWEKSSLLNEPPLFPNPTTSNPLRGFQDPLKGKGTITQSPGGDYSHTGNSYYAIDLGVPIGTSVYAMRSGKVIAIEDRFFDTGGGYDNRNNVNYVLIQHDNGYYSRYLHLQHSFNSSVGLQVGQTIQAGQLIAKAGNSGWSSGTHLHVQVDRNDWVSKPFEIEGVFQFA